MTSDYRVLGILASIAPDVEKLYETVSEYESDTFSAEAEKLTEAEAIHITATLARRGIKATANCDDLDGITMSELLGDIRD